MSFQDLHTGKFSCEIRKEKSQQAETRPGSAYVPFQQTLPQKAPVKKTRSIVLHGKVMTVTELDDSDPSPPESKSEQPDRLPQETVRQTLKRRSTFSKLAYETEQFQKLVTELEEILDRSGEEPEAAWRAKILIRSAQDTDKDLHDKLFQYERTLLTSRAGKENDHQQELRMAQSSCMKLHRDFNRSHKALVMALRTYSQRQKAEVSRLKNVGWSEVEQKDEDFFDRAMREREDDLKKTNRSMHQVNQIYQELATLVEFQQDDINQLEDDVQESRKYADDGFDSLRCTQEREHFCGAMNFVDFVEETYGCAPMKSSGIFQEDEGGEEKVNVSSRMDPNIRVSEPFNWFMPFETFREDMKAVHRDIVEAGKDAMLSVRKAKRRASSSS